MHAQLACGCLDDGAGRACGPRVAPLPGLLCSTGSGVQQAKTSCVFGALPRVRSPLAARTCPRSSPQPLATRSRTAHARTGACAAPAHPHPPPPPRPTTAAAAHRRHRASRNGAAGQHGGPGGGASRASAPRSAAASAGPGAGSGSREGGRGPAGARQQAGAAGCSLLTPPAADPGMQSTR